MEHGPWESIRSFDRMEYRWETPVFSQHTPVARKTHTCDGCCEDIVPGEQYVTYVTRNVEGPGWERWKAHGECFLEHIPMFTGKRPSWRWGLSQD